MFHCVTQARDHDHDGVSRAGGDSCEATGIAMYELFSAIEKHTTGWAHRGSNSQ